MQYGLHANETYFSQTCCQLGIIVKDVLSGVHLCEAQELRIGIERHCVVAP